ncbi:MAG TPA: Rieske (2Fe-2S) protein [Kofleriaceae bacterium]|nr:Rieske (2Fe-2S) protein [Kofleriaceae bacterium]
MKLNCSGCSRRALLQGLGLAALSACAGTPSQPSGTAATCGANLCLDLNDPANKDLTSAGGALIVDSSTDTIMVVRVSETQVAALSAICTHASCETTYTPSTMQLDCPCHGSQFSLSGAVVRGPARRSLRTYTATLSGTTITITLA